MKHRGGVMSERALREVEDEAISRLIERLNSLVDGEETVAVLVACGQAAVKLLRQFLMEGRPRGNESEIRNACEPSRAG